VDEHRRRHLAKEYLQLTDQYDALLDTFSCGVRLAEEISPKLAKFGRRIREIRTEVQAAMRGERL